MVGIDKLLSLEVERGHKTTLAIDFQTWFISVLASLRNATKTPLIFSATIRKLAGQEIEPWIGVYPV